MTLLYSVINMFLNSFTLFFPILMTLYSLIYVSYLGTVDWSLYIAIYLYFLINTFIENHIGNKANAEDNFIEIPNLLLEILNVLLLVYITWQSSLLNGLLLLSYTLFIHFQYVFIAYQMIPLVVLILAFLKAFIMPISLFYAQLNFVPIQLIRAASAFFLPVFAVQYNNYERKLKREELETGLFKPNIAHGLHRGIVLVSIPIAIFILWPELSWLSLGLLVVYYLTIKWFSIDEKRTHKILTRKHFLAFSFVFYILWASHFYIIK